MLKYEHNCFQTIDISKIKIIHDNRTQLVRKVCAY